MTEPQRQDWPKIIADLDRVGVSLYKLATLIEYRLGKDFQYTQVKRIRDTGRCEHFVGEIILTIHDDLVSHGTLQNVPSQSASMMQTA